MGVRFFFFFFFFFSCGLFFPVISLHSYLKASFARLYTRGNLSSQNNKI